MREVETNVRGTLDEVGAPVFYFEMYFRYMFFIKLKHGSFTQDTGITEVRVIVNKYSCSGHFLSSKIKRVIIEKACIIRVMMENKRKFLVLHRDHRADAGHVT